MPTHVQDDLFRLVKGLSTAEKGYVRRYWSRYSDESDQAYVELFDILNDMEVFEPATYRHKVQAHTWSRRAAAVKAYCMTRLLEALRSFHASTTPFRVLEESLLDVEILFDHGLRDEAAKRAEKVRKTATDLEAFLPLLRALAWLKRYRQLVQNEYETNEANDDLSKEQHRVLDVYRNSIAYEEFGNEMHMHILRASTGNKTSVQWLDNVLTSPLFTAPDQALSLSARFNYHLIRCNWFRMHRSDAVAALQEAATMNNMRRDYPAYFAARPDMSETSHYTFLFCLLEAGVMDTFTSEAESFYSWRKGAKAERDVRLASRSWLLEANYALYSKHYERLMEFEPAMQYFYEHQGDEIPPQYKVVVVFVMIRASYESNAAKRSSFWMQQMIQLDDDVRPDLHAASMLIELMVAVDRNDMTHVRSRTRSLDRYAKKYLGSPPYLTKVLSYFRRLPDASPSKARQLGIETVTSLGSESTSHAFDPVRASGIIAWFRNRYSSGEKRSP